MISNSLWIWFPSLYDCYLDVVRVELIAKPLSIDSEDSKVVRGIACHHHALSTQAKGWWRGQLGSAFESPGTDFGLDTFQNIPVFLVLLRHTDLRRSPKVVWTRSGPCLLPLMTNPSSALITAQEIVCSWPVKIARGVGTWIEISVLILIWIWTCITIERMFEIQTLKYLALPYDCLCSSIPMPKEHLLKKKCCNVCFELGTFTVQSSEPDTM